MGTPLEQQANNPLGLTVNAQGQILYPGQSGTLNDGINPFTFAEFPDEQTGFAAGVNYVQRHIASGAATTVQGLVNLFGPSDINAFEQAGYSPSTPLNPADASTYAALIAQGEGNAGVLASGVSSIVSED